MRSTSSLNHLDAFLAVADAGGFTAAAHQLGISKNALSQRVAQLERELGVALFVRTTRRVVMTPAGEQLRHRSVPLIRDLRTALDEVGSAQGQPTGTLRITAPSDFSAQILGPALAAFSAQHPQLRIDLVTSSEVQNLVDKRIDVSVRLGWLKDSSLKAVKLGEFSQLLVSAPDYLQNADPITHPSDLARHLWVSLTILSAPLHWQFKNGKGEACSVRVGSRTMSNSPEGVLGLLRGGAGLSVVTDFAAEPDLKQGRLQRVLPTWHLPDGGIYLTWPSSPQPSSKLRVFIEFMRAWLS